MLRARKGLTAVISASVHLDISSMTSIETFENPRMFEPSRPDGTAYILLWFPRTRLNAVSISAPYGLPRSRQWSYVRLNRRLDCRSDGATMTINEPGFVRAVCNAMIDATSLFPDCLEQLHKQRGSSLKSNSRCQSNGSIPNRRENSIGFMLMLSCSIARSTLLGTFTCTSC